MGIFDEVIRWAAIEAQRWAFHIDLATGGTGFFRKGCSNSMAFELEQHFSERLAENCGKNGQSRALASSFFFKEAGRCAILK
jgi:hypothetical protein